MLLDVAAVRTGTLVNWSEIVSAVSSARLVNVATPPETVSNGGSQQWSGAAVQSAAVTCVVLSPVSRLPYWSST